MLAIQPQSKPQTVIPNILPCKIHHSGPIQTAKRHWSPTPNEPTQTSYLRGRKLLGKSVKLPETHTGVILQKTDKILPQKPQARDEDEDEEEEQPVEVKVMEQKGTFEEVVVWGHEAVPGEEDVYVKGLKEWIGFAEAMHSYDTPGEKTS